MNRENKRMSYEKGYYKTHACNESFECRNCGRLVVPEGASSDHRNHCPYCLYSKHLDINPGDRANECGGLLRPIRSEPDARRGFIIIHKCEKCGAIRRNRAAHDAKVQPDKISLLIKLTASDY